MLCRNLPGKKLMLEPIEAIDQRCSVKKVFLEISQNSQKNPCARVSFLIKMQDFRGKRDSGTGVFL